MHHDQAKTLLPLLLSDELDPEQEVELSQHVNDCAGCRSWLATAELLEVTAGGIQAPNDRHPDSRTLVAYALAPGDMPLDDRKRTRLHVLHCRACSEDVALTRRAVSSTEPISVEEAHDEPPTTFRKPPQEDPRQKPRWPALAAAAAVLLLISYWGSQKSLGSDPEEVRLSDKELVGDTTVSARHRIVIGGTEVRPGAKVILESGGTVAFADGFRVGRNASLRVVVSPHLTRRGGSSN